MIDISLHATRADTKVEAKYKEYENVHWISLRLMRENTTDNVTLFVEDPHTISQIPLVVVELHRALSEYIAAVLQKGG
jgi:hypothetical protein